MKRAASLLEYQQSEYNVLNKSAMWLGNVALVFITPFAINNLINGQWQVAIIALLIISVFAFNTVTVLIWKTYFPKLCFFILSPAMMLFIWFAIPQQGIIGVLWSFPALVAFYFLLPERLAWVVNAVGLTSVFYLSWITFDHGLVIRIIGTMTLISLFTAVSVRLINIQQRKLHRLAITDYLTGLYNRNNLNQVLDEIIEHNHKSSENNHLMTIDIDHFKTINDKFGHETGDQALKNIASIIHHLVGDDGVVFRLGGEEFLVLLEQLSWQQAKTLAEMIRNTLENNDILPGFSTTASIGLSRLKPKMSRTDWIKESDQNLYQAKHLGRNQVVAS